MQEDACKVLQFYIAGLLKYVWPFCYHQALMGYGFFIFMWLNMLPEIQFLIQINSLKIFLSLFLQIWIK